jgi:heparosan-N-sulfate-glucuronate 5-epimerase
MTAIRRQPLAPFRPGHPLDGYYNDLRRFAQRNHGQLSTASNLVTVAQIGLGAWQLAASQRQWLDVVRRSAHWLMRRMDPEGRLPYEFPMGHTYRLDPPWLSAMAQGEAASLLLRAAPALGVRKLRDAAARAITCLTEPGTALVAVTPDGPVLQEYPTDPPAHVLNGWIFALWGLYDVAVAGPSPVAGRAMTAFHDGISALARRLPRYGLQGGWSRYDLRSHGPVNVASPFYHHLHIQQLRALSRLVDDPVFAVTASAWQQAWHDPVTVATAAWKKVRFRRHYRRGVRD